MHISTLELLRCPYCGGRLELVESLYHQRDADEIRDAILGCHCCIFPVIAGIPVLHLRSAAVTAREQVEAGQPDLALRTMIGLTDATAETFEAMAAAKASTYHDVVGAMGPDFEGGYFLYRFSDPTYLVADAVVRAVGRSVLGRGGRAVDLCGGSGHLTRSLTELSSETPVLADLYFVKVWLARQFTVPGCEAICCDGNAPLPFARGSFALAICSDAFQYIWTKRQFVAEMIRLVDRAGEPGAVVINHTHNELTWSPSHGQPLSPAGYRDLFETLEPRIFGESGLLSDVVKGGSLDLSRRDAPETLDAEAALTLIATRHPDVFRPHAQEPPSAARGEYRVNPLYEVQADGNRLLLSLRFPSTDYEDEYGACRRYLPEEAAIDIGRLNALQTGGPLTNDLADLVQRRVLLDLPRRYY